MNFKDFLKNKIRELRKEKGETQIQTAQAIGVSPRYYQNLELGENLPGLECFIAWRTTSASPWTTWLVSLRSGAHHKAACRRF